MLQIAVHKLFPEFTWNDVYISTGVKYKDTIAKQLPELPKENLIVEPEMRDVGPAVGLVIARLVKTHPNEPICLLWGSDHLVKNEKMFREILRTTEGLIEENPNRIVFIGQKPRYGNQNLGYIEFGDELKKANGHSVFSFTGFQYSPPLETAEKWAVDGHHAWNLGYFATSPHFLWKLFEDFAPDLYEKLKQIHDAYGTDAYEETLAKVYPTLEKISFDSAILEKMDVKDGLVISADIGWSDIGAWEAMKEALSETVEDNVTRGKIILEGSRDTLVHNETEQLVVGIDLDGLIVVNTGDVILICPKNAVPKVKKLVANLQGTEHEHLT